MKPSALAVMLSVFMSTQAFASGPKTGAVFLDWIFYGTKTEQTQMLITGGLRTKLDQARSSDAIKKILPYYETWKKKHPTPVCFSCGHTGGHYTTENRVWHASQSGELVLDFAKKGFFSAVATHIDGYRLRLPYECKGFYEQSAKNPVVMFDLMIAADPFDAPAAGPGYTQSCNILNVLLYELDWAGKEHLIL